MAVSPFRLRGAGQPQRTVLRQNDRVAPITALLGLASRVRTRDWIKAGTLVAIGAIATFLAVSSGTAALTVVAYENAVGNNDADRISSTVRYESTGPATRVLDAAALEATLAQPANRQAARTDVSVVSSRQVTKDLLLVTVSYRSGLSMHQEALRLERQPADHALLPFHHPEWLVVLPSGVASVSSPSGGADLSVDGRSVGRVGLVPASFAVIPGTHRFQLSAANHMGQAEVTQAIGTDLDTVTIRP